MPGASGKEGSKFRCVALEISDSRMTCYLHANLSKKHGPIEDRMPLLYVRQTPYHHYHLSEKIDNIILFSDEVKKRFLIVFHRFGDKRLLPSDVGNFEQKAFCIKHIKCVIYWDF